MSFLDNLENNLEKLESLEEAGAGPPQGARRRQSERERALAVAPWAERLKNSAFTAGLLRHATRMGFARRVKVHIAWLENTLRLEARERKLELRPTPEGIVAGFMEPGRETRTAPVDLEGDPEALAREWLEGLDSAA